MNVSHGIRIKMPPHGGLVRRESPLVPAPGSAHPSRLWRLGPQTMPISGKPEIGAQPECKLQRGPRNRNWIPACAGMSGESCKRGSLRPAELQQLDGVEILHAPADAFGGVEQHIGLGGI